MRALRHAPELTWDRGCLPWLYRVATNHCLNRLRDGDPLALMEPSNLPEPREGLASGVDDRLSARLQVLAFLRKVDSVTCQIALHSYLDGMTQDEIAMVMGLSRRTVGKKLSCFDQTVQAAQEASS